MSYYGEYHRITDFSSKHYFTIYTKALYYSSILKLYTKVVKKQYRAQHYLSRLPKLCTNVPNIFIKVVKKQYRAQHYLFGLPKLCNNNNSVAVYQISL